MEFAMPVSSTSLSDEDTGRRAAKRHLNSGEQDDLLLKQRRELEVSQAVEWQQKSVAKQELVDFEQNSQRNDRLKEGNRMFRHDYHNLHMSFLLPTDYMHQLT
jgi:outer membrane PBP1 activator LpoA protein